MPDGSGPSTSSIPSNLPLKSSSTSTKSVPLSRCRLAELISQGQTLVLHRRRVYKLDSWLKTHPGGDLAILHFVGRDATCEIEAYHSDFTLQRMKRFCIGWIREEDWYDQDDLKRRKEMSIQLDKDKDSHQESESESAATAWKPLTPPVQLGYRNGKLENQFAQLEMWNQRRKELDLKEAERSVDDLLAGDSKPLKVESSKESESRPMTFPIPVYLLEPPSPPSLISPSYESKLSNAWLELHKEVTASGLYDLKPVGYFREVLRYSFLAYLSYYFYQSATSTSEQSTPLLLLSSLFLGLLWHQLTFTAHDSGHSGITHIHWADRAIGVFIADYVGGLSIGWWTDNHDVHHLVTNHPEHDPDIQHMPFFAISDRFVGGDWMEGEKQKTDRTDEKIKESNDSQAQAQPKSSTPSYLSLSLYSTYYRRFIALDAPSLFLLKFQHYLYYPIMSLGRFNLYANSYSFLALKAKRDRWLLAEVLGLVLFWGWFGGIVIAGIQGWKVKLAYTLTSHIVTSPLHVQVSFPTISNFLQPLYVFFFSLRVSL